MPEAATTFHEDLSPLDSFFLYAERSEAPLHIGAVYVFEGEPRGRGGRGAQGIEETLRERLHLVPRYRQRVRFRPLNLGHPVWVDDAEFDLGHHVRHASLPKPGSAATLRDFAARLLAKRLDLNRPLWDMTVVEGLTGGRVAVVSRVHHALVDGISSVDLSTLLFDSEPYTAPMAAPLWEPRPAPGDLDLALPNLDGLRKLTEINPLSLNPFTLPARLTSMAKGLAAEAVASPWAGAASLALSLVRPGPQVFFNRLIGVRRRIAHLTVPLADLREVKDVFAATVNDVVLAMVAEAMHGWLAERGEPVPDSLRVFCPVSVRDPSQRYALGNQVSGIVVDLPTAAMPPVTRLARITAATADLKRSGQAVAARSLTALTSWAPATLQALGSRIASQPQFGLQSRVNLVVTNVPGPQVPFYSGGAQMLEVWPFVPIYHTLGLNVALVSYNGQVHVGLTADRDLVPDLDRFRRWLEVASAEYLAIARRLRRPIRRGAAGGMPRASRRPAGGSPPFRAPADLAGGARRAPERRKRKPPD